MIFVNTLKMSDKKSIEKILTLLGFASKARKLVYGKENIREYIKNNGIIVMASNIGKRIKKDILIRGNIYGCKIIILEGITKEYLGKKLGKNDLSVVGVKDREIIDGIIEVVERGGVSG